MRWRPLLVSTLVLLAAAACSETVAPPAQPTPSPTTTAVSGTRESASPTPTVPPPAPSPTPAAIRSIKPAPAPAPAPIERVILPEPPDRDLFELAQRLRPTSTGPVSRIVSSEPVSYDEGHSETFWVSNLEDASVYTIDATLQFVSEHAYWYIDDEVEASREDLERAAEAFESQIHAAVVGSLGDIWNPGVDNDPRLTILHTPLKAAAGYYGSRDEYPRQTHPNSNQREMIYMDSSLRPGSRIHLKVLAHELQHAVHWNLDPGEDSWVNEGMSEVAGELAGYPASFVDAFLDDPGAQLNYWPDPVGATAPHYSAASLFLAYLAQHYGGYDALADLVREPRDGANGVEAYLSSYDATFLQVFKDWVVANYVDAPEGIYGYADRAVRVRDVLVLDGYGEVEGELAQFSARYVDLRLGQGDAVVRFQGDAQVGRFAGQCHSGRHCWWGNRGDSIDSTLTRRVDLSGLAEASLEFWTWYGVEKDWDYAYVQVSADSGDTWSILEGRHTTSDNPTGNSYGHGWTGASGGWVKETVDLSPYAGSKVLLRFEYITDDAVYLDGFVVDDLAIPELGYFDDAEEDGGWDARGFVRTDNILAQKYLVQIVEETVGGDVSVREMEMEDGPRGEVRLEGLGSRLVSALVVISPVTRDTHQSVRYTLSVAAPETRG